MGFLSEKLLEAIHGRAAHYDAENTFPYEDLNDLRAAGYLAAFVPTEFGGAGLTLEEIAAEQTRLAKAAPAPRSGSICTRSSWVWGVTSCATGIRAVS